MKGLKERIKGLFGDEEGATAVEYGVLVALIIAACVIVIGAIGTRIESAFNSVVSAIDAAG